jgi:hypothetical protein
MHLAKMHKVGESDWKRLLQDSILKLIQKEQLSCVVHRKDYIRPHKLPACHTHSSAGVSRPQRRPDQGDGPCRKAVALWYPYRKGGGRMCPFCHSRQQDTSNNCGYVLLWRGRPFPHGGDCSTARRPSISWNISHTPEHHMSHVHNTSAFSVVDPWVLASVDYIPYSRENVSVCAH